MLNEIKWHDVKKELPKNEQPCVLFTIYGEYAYGEYREQENAWMGEEFWYSIKESDFMVQVTHWHEVLSEPVHMEIKSYIPPK